MNASFTWNKAVEQALRNATKKTHLAVGIPEDEEYPKGKKVSEVAMILEFGTEKIAPRAFLRGTVDERKGKWIEDTGRRLKKVARGKGGSARTVMKVLGAEVKADIQERTPVKTGKLRDSFTVKVD